MTHHNATQKRGGIPCRHPGEGRDTGVFRGALDFGNLRNDGFRCLDGFIPWSWIDPSRLLKLLAMNGLAAVAILLPCLAKPCAAIEITDDLGRTITLAQPARRIIPLYGAFSEMLFTMGAGKQVAARTQADQFPPEIEKLPSIGTHMKPNVEMILGLKPDLVIQSEARNAASDEIRKIQEAGIPVAVFGAERFEELFSVMRRLGVLAGCTDEAEKAIVALEERLRAVRARVGSVTKKRRIFFEVRSEPLAAAGQGSIVQEVIDGAGAENVVKSPKGIIQYNLETLLTEDVDFYVVQRGPMNRNPVEPARRTHFDRVRAVLEGKVLTVDELIYSRPGPRSVLAVEELAAAVYPERFANQ
ncbi:MAG: ABC transporter substrate-binding protein [Syntrophobacteraceae bacterium]